MAIDSSIWIYQFQATMRDKDGRVLVNAHVLGFLRRITKLLFYGIKPVFVFDGGAPALKRSTLNERKRKKSGAATSHAKIAERLLAARLRKEALDHTHGVPKRKGNADDERKIVYLEDVDPTIPKARPRQDTTDSTTTSPSNSPSKKKSRFYDHDPYRLPDVDIEAVVAKATKSTAPDPRLATEEELRTFVEEMRPEDFDITAPAFRQLPTEIQYEIIGDLRLKSRQTSHARLEKMLRHSRTPMDFSKAQIQNLRQRNALTQQLLTTTDSIGKAHISIPVRIASERNKEYILIKNESEAGGWILGVRDHGTREKPIVIGQDDDDASSDGDMEEVEVGLQSEMAPQAIGRHNISKGLEKRPVSSNESNVLTKKSQSTPLFDLDDDDISAFPPLEESESENEELSFAIQASLDDARTNASDDSHDIATTVIPTRTHTTSLGGVAHELFTSPSRLETVLSFANISPSSSKTSRRTSLFGGPSLLSKAIPDNEDSVVALDITEDGLDDAYIDVDPTPLVPQAEPTVDAEDIEGHISDSESRNDERATPEPTAALNAVVDEITHVLIPIESDSDEDMEEVITESPPQALNETPECAGLNLETENIVSQVSDQAGPESQNPSITISEEPDSTEKDDDPIPWFRSPSPAEVILNEGASSQAIDENWDAAQEMDPRVEEGEYARFMSHIKGRDLAEVRREIDEEIASLNQQRKAAMRDSEDITQQMIAQIMAMLRLFGIPYITAPMEAEAQCAELVSLGLVDGVITDDSDVFLFGAKSVFKNMFNQSKTVECFLLSDLSRELGLDRDTLVRLAYLLGSDYVEGLSGVGPVVAMELLKEFPGMDGLHKFKDWWEKVQSGRDTVEDNKSKFRDRKSVV